MLLCKALMQGATVVPAVGNKQHMLEICIHLGRQLLATCHVESPSSSIRVIILLVDRQVAGKSMRAQAQVSALSQLPRAWQPEMT